MVVLNAVIRLLVAFRCIWRGGQLLGLWMLVVGVRGGGFLGMCEG